jgi:ABC-type cobalamin/Fe3+-siderophores transport system ATPase subunit
VRSNLSIPDRILVRDFVMLGMQKKNFELFEKVMKETNIQNFLDRTLISLSDGERSRVLLAEALIRNTSLLLLDEPTAFLDVPRSIDLFKLLKSIAVNENKGILISTHQVEHALKYADRLLVFLRNGQVVSGLVEDVLKRGALSWAELD